mgnify:CR=1 FL=1
MRISIKAKQVAAVTSIVGLAVIALSLLQIASLARVSLQESRERGWLLRDAIFHRASQVVAQAPNPYEALRSDPGLRSILESGYYSKGVTYAAIVDLSGVAVAHSDSAQIGKRLQPAADLDALLDRNGLEIYRAVQTVEGQTLEVRQPLLFAGAEFGSIRIGVSTLLVRKELNAAIKPALVTAASALAVATLVAMFLAQLILRPIHVIRGALGRLGQGEFGMTLDMQRRDEFGELGSFFNALSAQLSADRMTLAGEKAKLESIVDHLEDAIAIFAPDGGLLFANPALRAMLPPEPFTRPIDDVLPEYHPYRHAVRETLASGQSYGPMSARIPAAAISASTAATPNDETVQGGERLIMTHAIKGPDDRLVGVMLVARDLDYLSRVQSTIAYSRKLVALGRLSAGVAHEVKNPLNAMTIHLELLKHKLAAAKAAGEAAGLSSGTALADRPAAPAAAADGVAATGPAGVESALEHVRIIANEIGRLDEVLQGFLKFTRPEDLKLQAIEVRSLVEEVARVVGPEAARAGVGVEIECPESVPDIRGDPAMLRQALLNLAINACQAMPGGGRLQVACSPARGRRVEIKVEDSGVGISPENLERIFNLYFTTKPHGSGIGLSMVYRTVQLHDGDIDVQSTPGVGTTFRLLLPQL